MSASRYRYTCHQLGVCQQRDLGCSACLFEAPGIARAFAALEPRPIRAPVDGETALSAAEVEHGMRRGLIEGAA